MKTKFEFSQLFLKKYLDRSILLYNKNSHILCDYNRFTILENVYDYERIEVKEGGLWWPFKALVNKYKYKVWFEYYFYEGYLYICLNNYFDITQANILINEFLKTEILISGILKDYMIQNKNNSNLVFKAEDILDGLLEESIIFDICNIPKDILTYNCLREVDL